LTGPDPPRPSLTSCRSRGAGLPRVVPWPVEFGPVGGDASPVVRRAARLSPTGSGKVGVKPLAALLPQAHCRSSGRSRTALPQQRANKPRHLPSRHRRRFPHTHTDGYVRRQVMPGSGQSPGWRVRIGCDCEQVKQEETKQSQSPRPRAPPLASATLSLLGRAICHTVDSAWQVANGRKL
jgi:hypothetical protein